MTRVVILREPMGGCYAGMSRMAFHEILPFSSNSIDSTCREQKQQVEIN
jgi:hypothetical protein